MGPEKEKKNIEQRTGVSEQLHLNFDLFEAKVSDHIKGYQR